MLRQHLVILSQSLWRHSIVRSQVLWWHFVRNDASIVAIQVWWVLNGANDLYFIGQSLWSLREVCVEHVHTVILLTVLLCDLLLYKRCFLLVSGVLLQP